MLFLLLVYFTISHFHNLERFWGIFVDEELAFFEITSVIDIIKCVHKLKIPQSDSCKTWWRIGLFVIWWLDYWARQILLEFFKDFNDYMMIRL